MTKISFWLKKKNQNKQQKPMLSSGFVQSCYSSFSSVFLTDASLLKDQTM